MDDTVHITFSQHLNAGETSFKVKVPQQFLDKDRKFGLEFLTLVPDYHSKQAEIYNIDPESEKDSVVEDHFHIGFELDNQFLQVAPWEQPQENVSLGVIITSLNNYFLTTKPKGCIYPLVYVDWYHLDAPGTSREEDLEFYKTRAVDLYGEAFNVEKHLGHAPPSMIEIHGFNGMLFPTSDSPNVVSRIRVQVWMAPNTKLAFSNYDLPQTLGFADNQLPQRVNNQVQLSNPSLDQFSLHECDNEPAMHVLKGAKTSKVRVYMNYKSGMSIRGRLATTMSRMHSLVNTALDYNRALQNMAKRLNFDLNLMYDATQKIFKFIFPKNRHINMIVYVSTTLASQLGFGPVEQITPQMTPQVVEKEDKLQERALALVLDTRMVVVNLEQSASQQNFHFKKTLMAILEPDSLGIMSTKRNGMSLPRVPVSYYNPTLEFVLHRFDELGKPINLEWKVGGHIQGVLSGTV